MHFFKLNNSNSNNNNLSAVRQKELALINKENLFTVAIVYW